MSQQIETAEGLPRYRVSPRKRNAELAKDLFDQGFFSSGAFQSSERLTLLGRPKLLLSDSGWPSDPDWAKKEDAAPAAVLSAETLLAEARRRWGGRYRRALRQLSSRFQIVELLGRGGMGEVYRAYDRQAEREVALKLAPGELSKNRLERFRREGEITASLQHPGIVGIHTAGDQGGIPFLVYELVEGGTTLRDVTAEATLRERLELIRDAALALGHAHSRGVVHRDVKPANILIDVDGTVRVADFGLAAARQLSRITQADTILGTPYFMAPEQVLCKRDQIGPATDVWALGVILYQALTGCFPFESDGTLSSLRKNIVSASPARPEAYAEGLPAGVADVCLRALERDPRKRQEDGDAFAEDLRRVLEGEATEATLLQSISAPFVSAARSTIDAHWPAALPRPTWTWTWSLLLGATLPLLVGLSSLLGGRAVATPVDTRAPFLGLVLPAQRVSETLGSEVLLKGTIRDAARWVDVLVGEHRVRATPGEGFSLTVPVRVGWNRLELVGVDAAGNRSAPRTVIVRRREAPEWYRKLPAAKRPPLPLPEGIGFGYASGEFVGLVDGSTLLWVPPGAFTMGANEREFEGGALRAAPAHRVRISRGFFIGKYELTWGQYRRFCAQTGRAVPAPRFPVSAFDPVHGVSWDSARDYCAWAGLRLPTEAEWEFAARGESGHEYPSGNAPRAGARPRFNSEGIDDGYVHTAPVGSFPRGVSSVGAHDMAGNVMEWVEDRYGPFTPGAQADPTGPSRGEWRVFRGGCMRSPAWFCRTTYRDGGRPSRGLSGVGFRLAGGR